LLFSLLQMHRCKSSGRIRNDGNQRLLQLVGTYYNGICRSKFFSCIQLTTRSSLLVNHVPACPYSEKRAHGAADKERDKKTGDAAASSTGADASNSIPGERDQDDAEKQQVQQQKDSIHDDEDVELCNSIHDENDELGIQGGDEDVEADDGAAMGGGGDVGSTSGDDEGNDDVSSSSSSWSSDTSVSQQRDGTTEFDIL
jgi:hypothetical protein